MPMSEDEFQQKLKMLGLNTDNTPASQPDLSSIPDPDQSDAPQGQQNPGIGYQGQPDQEKSPLIAATPEEQASAQPPAMPQAPNMSVQPSAQVASSDRGDTGGDPATDPNSLTPQTKALMPVPGKKQSPQEQASAQKDISSIIQNPVVSQYIQNKYGEKPDLNDVALKEAQAVASQKRMVAGIGQGLETIARAPSNTKVNTEFYQQMDKDADAGVNDIMTRRKAQTQDTLDNISKLKLQEQTEDNDPNSPAANELRKQYANTFKALGVDADALKSASPRIMKEYYQKMLDSANIAEARKAVAEMNAEARKAAQHEKAEKGINERVTKFSEALDPNKARGGQLALSQGTFNNAEKLEGLVQKSAAGMNLDQRETEDFALGLAKMLSGSNATSRAQVEALVPRTAQGSAQKIAEWVSNDPKGLDQQAFIKRMVSTVQREKEISRQQILNAQMQRIGGYEDLPEDKRNDVMQNYGIQPEDYKAFKDARKSGGKAGVDFEKIPQQGHEATPPIQQKPGAATPMATTSQPKQSGGFPKQVTKTDPTSGKTLTATVSNDKELAEANGEGFN